ncbi:MAG: hypothetical protein RJQ09_12000 [Cyclobacteriaceae bacterium]|uniref:hypothetical protein n=1 Tax=Imperialibacter sp. TaxID=2038411 RepID=UPI0032EC46BA
MKLFQWSLLILTSSAIGVLSAIFYLGTEEHHNILKEDIIWNFASRALTFSLLGIPSILLILAGYLILAKSNKIKPNYPKIVLESSITILAAAIVGTTFFFV